MKFDNNDLIYENVNELKESLRDLIREYNSLLHDDEKIKIFLIENKSYIKTLFLLLEDENFDNEPLKYTNICVLHSLYNKINKLEDEKIKEEKKNKEFKIRLIVLGISIMIFLSILFIL